MNPDKFSFIVSWILYQKNIIELYVLSKELEISFSSFSGVCPFSTWKLTMTNDKKIQKYEREM